MTDFLIACDDKDSTLGEYLNDTFLILCEKCDLLCDKFNIELVDTDSCNSYPIEDKIQSFKSRPFLFLSLAHGNEDAIYLEKNEIINESNSELFRNSFFYAISCLTAINLGEILIKNGCKTYIGYDDEVSIILTHKDIFRDCQLHGMEKFINESISSQDSYNRMITKYDLEIDNLCISNQTVVASYLLANREALVIKGESNSFLMDFSYYHE